MKRGLMVADGLPNSAGSGRRRVTQRDVGHPIYGKSPWLVRNCDWAFRSLRARGSKEFRDGKQSDGEVDAQGWGGFSRDPGGAF
jgi:hypothetical protein